MAEKVLTIPGMITVGELAEKLNLPVTTLVGELFKNGIMATVNQRIDFETAQIIVEELGLDVQMEQQKAAADTGAAAREQRALSDKAQERPPIVAVMGHVDHGKTSLLDALLDMKVVTGEAGGITQHISAYQTTKNDRTITLLDTPGHEAFSALRQHGAALTDVVIIVVAADDGVKPQTIEAIKFARAANAKMVVALNKIDKDTANPGMVMGQLAEQGVVADAQGWGGDVPMVEVSAKTGQNLEALLDTVLLVADLEELKAEVDGAAEGLVIESHMETGRGAVVSLLVEHGILKSGMFLVAGPTYAKVRTLTDFADRPMKQAGPSTPATVTGFKEIPEFGDRFVVVKNEKEARLHSAGNKQKAAAEAASTNITGSDLLKMISQNRETVTKSFVVKADVQGSLTSVVDSLRLIDSEEVNVRIIAQSVGNITENDIRTAAGADGIVYGFNVQLPPAVKQLAAREKVSVRIYRVIYELLDDARNELEAMLAPEVIESEIGTLTLKGIFRTTRDELICGGEVTGGKAVPKVLARISRGDEQLAEAEVISVQREKAEAREVFEGELCGLNLKTHGKVNAEVGDKVQFFTRELKKRTLQ